MAPYILTLKINCHEPIRVTARPIRNKLVRNNLTTIFWGNDAGCQLNLFQTFYTNVQLKLKADNAYIVYSELSVRGNR